MRMQINKECISGFLMLRKGRIMIAKQLITYLATNPRKHYKLENNIDNTGFYKVTNEAGS